MVELKLTASCTRCPRWPSIPTDPNPQPQNTLSWGQHRQRVPGERAELGQPHQGTANPGDVAQEGDVELGDSCSRSTRPDMPARISSACTARCAPATEIPTASPRNMQTPGAGTALAAPLQGGMLAVQHQAPCPDVVIMRPWPRELPGARALHSLPGRVRRGLQLCPEPPPGQPFDPLSSAPSPPGATLPASSIAE